MSKKNVEWEWKKLGDVCEVIAGQSPKGSSYNNNEEGMEFHQGKKSFGKTIIESSGVWTSEITKIASPEDILISVRAPVGPVNFTDRQLCIGRGLAAIRAKHIDKKYLYLFLVYNESNMTSKTGAVFDSISRNDIINFEIPIPPLDEQERIVKVLDDAFEKIDTIKTTVETNLQNAKDLFQTTLKKLFREISKDNHELLKNVAIDFSRGKSKHRPRNDKKLFGGNYPFIQTGDIRNSGKYLIEYTDTYNEFGLSQSKLWPKGTLCITIAANIAETTILTIPCCFPDSVIGFIPNENRTTVDYVFYVLQFFKSELQILGKGAAQDNLNLATFEKMTFPFPPLPIQKQIVAKLDSLSEKVKQLESNYKQILANCDELKKALLKQAFEGML
ncbi:restriction endonuclease subunit S [Fibrobacter sp. UWH1]|uniref:restriction endonuclease subunit S n=1 Tax=Fibrobacter sp. UWH1 TaxID=1964354 RepID=UPI000B5201EC|nr:restriction endonuclease subunit S [Fibrobacter sp. UWH1]OWV14869.1 restriction endonuclease subunit S [Fibrobacter sp. UWH1]